MPTEDVPEAVSRIRKVVVQLGRDGLAYVKTVYGNGQIGQTSEGYGANVHEYRNDEDSIREGLKAAHADWDALGIPVEVIPPED